MLTKILFTALVIAVVVIVARTRAQARRTGAASSEGAGEPTDPRRARKIAMAVAAALLLGAGLFYWQHWRSWHEVVTVRVINVQSHDVATYAVHKGTIHERSFRTVDGWKVTVSDQERVEVQHPD